MTYRNRNKLGRPIDPFGPEAVEQARKGAISVGVMVNYKTSFCAMCRLDKPKAGSKKLGSMYVCADCQGERA